MVNDGKNILTKLSNEKDYSKKLVEFLYNRSTLSSMEAEYLFAVAIIFINEYEKDRSKKYYIEFAYSIIVRTCFKINDFRALFDFSVNYGFYPIAYKILQEKLILDISVTHLLANVHIKNFTDENNILTFEQYNQMEAIMNSKEKEVLFLAPTSYGKSSLIYKHILANDEKNIVGIIVPTKALIDQVFREAKKTQGLKRKIIMHDQNYDHNTDNRILAVVTQERALRLIEQGIIFDTLYIDESHELFRFDFRKKYENRSLLLSRLIRISKLKNNQLNIYYFSPMIQNSKSLQMIDSTEDIKEFSINNNLKILDIRYLNSKSEHFVYDKFLGNFTKVGTVQDNFNFILQTGKKYQKNLHFLYRPIFVEKYSEQIYSELTVPKSLSNSLEELISELKELIHPNFKLIKYLEKGVLYLHGRLPNNIRNYLLKCFRDDESIIHLVSNSVILAGMNLPIDNLFYISGTSNTNDLYNLIGRVNRLSQIFGETGNLKKLIVPVHFIDIIDFPQNRSGVMENKIMSLRSKLSDNIQNPLLKNSTIREENSEISKQIISIENNLLKDIDNPDFVSKITRAGAQQILNYTPIGLKKLEKVISNAETVKGNEEIFKLVLYKIKEIFFDSFIMDNEEKAIEYKYFSPNYNVKRLRYDVTLNYYAGYISSSFSPLKNRIEKLVQYWKDIIDGKNTKNYFQYVGSQFGETVFPSRDYIDSTAEVYIDLSTYKDREYDLYNMAIIKLQTDDDFLNFEIGLLVNTLKEFEIISEDQYNIFLFGTKDQIELKIIQLGISKPIYMMLKRDNQIQNIVFDKYKNIRANKLLEEYIKTKIGIERFELEQYFM